MPRKEEIAVDVIKETCRPNEVSSKTFPPCSHGPSQDFDWCTYLRKCNEKERR